MKFKFDFNDRRIKALKSALTVSIARMNQILVDDPGNAKAYKQLQEYLFLQGEFDRALVLTAEAINKNIDWEEDPDYEEDI